MVDSFQEKFDTSVIENTVAVHYFNKYVIHSL